MNTTRIFERQSLAGAAVRLAAINRLCRVMDGEGPYDSRPVLSRAGEAYDSRPVLTPGQNGSRPAPIVLANE